MAGYGGAGRTFDWNAARILRRITERDILVAGGLDPDNVGEAIRIARPWGVDVASGVEKAPGIKDHARLEAFVAKVRRAAAAQPKEETS